MEFQNYKFISDSFPGSPYTAQQHCKRIGFTSCPPDDAFQMQYLRFPTPPITPPNADSAGLAIPERLVQIRTQSVIMKVGQGHSPLISALDEEAKYPAQEASSSSISSSPCSDFVCDWSNCGRYFENLELLAAHVTQVHAVASLADGLYYCRWTGCARTRGFNARYKMLVHVRTHTKEKPHQCQLCGKSFSRAENLKIHFRSHSGEKPYVCPYEGCQKAYSNSSDRFKHTRTHSMEKPYMCKVQGCQKRYTDPSSLRKHVKTFKHDEQLLGSTFVPSPATVATSNKVDSFGYCHSLEPLPRPTHINAEPYYMDVNAEDVCHIKATQLECCYYTADSPRGMNYWLSNGGEGSGGSTHVDVEVYTDDNHLSMELDSPLDLRTNRT